MNQAAANAVADPPIPPDLIDPKTPKEVKIRLSARPPVTEPTLGIAVSADGSAAKHRLVSIGDSLTHGFQSLAIFNTDLSYPALIARELGWHENFLHPEYPGYGGLPLDLEFVLHQLDAQYGSTINVWELAPAFFFIRNLINEIELYWEQGSGSRFPPAVGINHNLGIYGWDLRDILAKTAATEQALLDQLLAGGPTTIGLIPIGAGANVKRYMQICGRMAAIRVLESARNSAGVALTPLEAARALGDDGGIETLTVFIGANNALGTVLELGDPRWSGEFYNDSVKKDAYNVWLPSHFEAEYRLIAEAIGTIKASHVIFCTVPHITIAPIARGVGTAKMLPGSRYFDYYTRVWITDDDFDPVRDPHLTGNQARAIDSAIDQYNDAIVNIVRDGRNAGMDWLVLDTAGVLDRMAYRRYLADPSAQPAWWTPYPLPPALAALNPSLDTRFFASDPAGRSQGGLIALDGVHPTTAAYGILAQELIQVMQAAGVIFKNADNTPRSGRVNLDFDWLLTRDTLLMDPPLSLTPDLKALGWLNEMIDFATRLAWH